MLDISIAAVGYIAITLAMCLGMLLSWLNIFGKAKLRHLPGPRGLPLFGNQLDLKTNLPHLQLTQWSKQYGDLYSLRLYGHDVLVISSDQLIRQVLLTDSVAFAGRPSLVRTGLVHHGGFYVTRGDYSQKWATLKRLVVNGLRTYGSGLGKVEHLVMERCNVLLETLTELENSACDIRPYLLAFMAEIDLTLTCGQMMHPEQIKSFTAADDKAITILSPAGEGYGIDLIPWLQYFPNSTLTTLAMIDKAFGDIFQPAIEDRKRNYSGGPTECIVDCLIKYNKGMPEEHQFSSQDIRSIVEDLCTAGFASTTSVLLTLLVMSVANPEMQSSIQAQLDNVLGSRAPSLSDRANFPLVEAAIFEALRFSTPIPISVPHKTTRNVEIGGYSAKKGTHVWINLWSLHHDDRYWRDPWSFKPERFLDNGCLVPPDHPNRRRLLTFGAGRRACVGENLAKSRIFLVFVSILQRFTVVAAEGAESIITDPRKYKGGIVLYPHYTKMKFIPRELAVQK